MCPDSPDIRFPAPVSAQVCVKNMVSPAAVDLQVTLRNAFVFVAAFFQNTA
jgi:hypothetical protein